MRENSFTFRYLRRSRPAVVMQQTRATVGLTLRSSIQGSKRTCRDYRDRTRATSHVMTVIDSGHECAWIAWILKARTRNRPARSEGKRGVRLYPDIPASTN
jgi:hypothetical protein